MANLFTSYLTFEHLVSVSYDTCTLPEVETVENGSSTLVNYFLVDLFETNFHVGTVNWLTFSAWSIGQFYIHTAIQLAIGYRDQYYIKYDS